MESKMGTSPLKSAVSSPHPSKAAASSASPGKSAVSHSDPWGLEKNGEKREIYELEEHDPAMRRHVVLARKAASQYQTFDTFARVSMTFGTNQLMLAIGYYAMGYVALQDGAVYPAWCVVIIMGSMAASTVQLDFSLTWSEQLILVLLSVASLLASSALIFACQMQGELESKYLYPYLLP